MAVEYGFKEERSTIFSELFILKNFHWVKIKKTGNITEITHQTRKSNSCGIRLLKGGKYIKFKEKTGEVYECNKIENRSENITSIKKSMSRLRDIINTNIDVAENCSWITLTYQENMQDSKRLYTDYKKFIMRLRTFTKKEFEYIACYEPQERGAWHVHLILKYNEKAMYIKNSVLADIWGMGFVKIQRLANVDNIGAYLSAYLGNTEFNDKLKKETDRRIVQTVNCNGKEKKFIKGARLALYPPKFNLYSCSRGIIKPTEYYDTFKNAKADLWKSALTKRYSYTYKNDDFQNTITREYYNSKLKKNK